MSAETEIVENIEEKLWMAFPSREPVNALEIRNLIWIWESLRGSPDGERYLRFLERQAVRG